MSATKRRHLLVTVIVCTALLGVSATRAYAAAAVLSGAELVYLGTAGDGRIVILEGEAIGDVLSADRDHRWVNLLSDGVAIGVWMTVEDAGKIDTLGDYRARGQIVRATGTFNYACDLHGGDLDVHARTVEVVAAGSRTHHPIHPGKLIIAAALAVGAGVQYYLYRRARRREP